MKLKMEINNKGPGSITAIIDPTTEVCPRLLNTPRFEGVLLVYEDSEAINVGTASDVGILGEIRKCLHMVGNLRGLGIPAKWDFVWNPGRKELVFHKEMKVDKNDRSEQARTIPHGTSPS